MVDEGDFFSTGSCLKPSIPRHKNRAIHANLGPFEEIELFFNAIMYVSALPLTDFRNSVVI